MSVVSASRRAPRRWSRVRAAPGLDDKEELGVGEQALLVAEIVRLYVRVRWLMRTCTAQEAVDELRRTEAPRIPPSVPAPAARITGLRVANAVERTLAVIPADGTCLKRSLVLIGLLARRGVDSQLVIGVKSGSSFEAHAWVEHGGRPLLDTHGDRFARLTEL
jgi:hypothetical protein